MKLVWYTALAVIALLFTGTLYITNQLSERIAQLEVAADADHTDRIERLELVKHTEVVAFVRGVSVLCGHQEPSRDLFDFDAQLGADLYTANLNGIILVTQLKEYGLRPEKTFCENELDQFIKQNGL